MTPDRESKNWYLGVTSIALILVVALAVADAVLAPTPAPRQPDFIDTILVSKAVVVALRIAIVFAALFVVLSIVALIARRQWLTRVGPVEVSGLEAEKQLLKEGLEDAHRVIDVLEGVVANTHRLIDKERDT